MKGLDSLTLVVHSVVFAFAGVVLAVIIYGLRPDSTDPMVISAEKELLRQAGWFYSANGFWIGWVVGCLTLITHKLSKLN